MQVGSSSSSMLLSAPSATLPSATSSCNDLQRQITVRSQHQPQHQQQQPQQQQPRSQLVTPASSAASVSCRLATTAERHNDAEHSPSAALLTANSRCACIRYLLINWAARLTSSGLSRPTRLTSLLFNADFLTLELIFYRFFQSEKKFPLFPIEEWSSCRCRWHKCKNF